MSGQLGTWVRAVAVAAIAAAWAPQARAHEVLYDVVHGGAVAVHVFESDGDAVADAQAEIFSPRDSSAPYQRGRTDRNGWTSFVPDAPGAWRVRVVGEDGHGLDVRIEVDRVNPRAAGAEGAGTAPASGLKFVLRPVAGVVAIVAVFVALFLWMRRGGTGTGPSA